MRHVYAALLLIAIATGCEKGPFNPKSAPKADFTISRTRVMTNGETVSKVETALNLDESSKFTADLQIKGANLVLEIGGKKVTTVEPTLRSAIVFYNQTDPMKIAGTYKFPDDHNRVDVFLCDIIGQAQMCIDEPIGGELIISYDPALKRWNGIVKGLKYNIPPGADYVREDCEVKFSDILFKN